MKKCTFYSLTVYLLNTILFLHCGVQICVYSRCVHSYHRVPLSVRDADRDTEEVFQSHRFDFLLSESVYRPALDGHCTGIHWDTALQWNTADSGSDHPRIGQKGEKGVGTLGLGFIFSYFLPVT